MTAQVASFKSDTYTPDRLIASNAASLLGEKGTLLAGQNLLRGALLGRITASGKLVLSLSAAGDGSQTPVAILADDCDATAADKECLFYVRGDFNNRAVIYGAAHTFASVKAGLQAKSIWLVDTVAA